MALTIDLAALAGNSALVAASCRSAGLEPLCVFKQAYAIPQIISAVVAGGIGGLLASTPASAGAVEAAGYRVRGLLGGWDSQATQDDRLPRKDVTCISVAAARDQLAQRYHGRIWLEVLTSDGKEGLSPPALLELLGGCAPSPRGRVPRIGLLFNWGCLGGPPTRRELGQAGRLISRVQDMLGWPVATSFGGSALLPMLGTLPLTGGRRFLRVGEAILVGMIPSASGPAYGLQRPIWLDARVLDVRRAGDASLMLIGRGHTCLDADEVTQETGWKVRGAATESMLVEIAPGDMHQAGDTVLLPLGYRSAVRSLLNRTVDRDVVSYDRPHQSANGTSGL